MKLDERAQALRDLLAVDPGIDVSLEDCRTLLIADFIERVSQKGLTRIG